MKYIIMCGGEYKDFETPKQLSVINGEVIVERTIRLLKENGIEDIYISSNSQLFDNREVPRLENKNNDYIYYPDTDTQYGYWLDAFYKVDTPVTYLFGDVYYTNEAIKTITNYKTDKNILFGTSDAYNEQHFNWGEPFAYIVNDTEVFFKGIEEVKRLYDEGKIIRHPIVWELYRYLNNLDINIQRVLEETYVCIDDGTMDVDSPKELEEMRKKVGA